MTNTPSIRTLNANEIDVVSGGMTTGASLNAMIASLQTNEVIQAGQATKKTSN